MRDRGKRRVRRSWGSRVLTWVVGLVVLLLVVELVVFCVSTWQLARWVERTLTVSPHLWSSPVEVTDVTADSVTLKQVKGGPTWLDASQVYGLDWGSGWGFVTAVQSDKGSTVVRGLQVMAGPRPTAGSTARFSRDAYPTDPRRAFPDAQVSELTVRGATADLPAYFVPGRSRTWAVLVHGAGANRSEMFRLMTSTMAAGLPSLDITYRGDQETGGGFARLGTTEWRDLEAAVKLAEERGASNVVLVGVSMGGAIVADFLEHSDLAGDVTGVVLDSPLLDFHAAVALAADGGQSVHVPLLGSGPVASAAIRLARARTDLDGSPTDHLADTSWLKVPTLLLHGEDDPRVPVDSSRALAAAKPDLVTAHYVAKAGHVESWNEGPPTYDRWVREFLRPFGA